MTIHDGTILVVDDAPMLRELQSIFLSRAARVITACDGLEGLRRVRSDRPDLVLTDLHMPGLDGDGLCHEIRRDPELRDIPVIIVISGNHADERARAVHAGADDVLLKPLSRITLMETVNRFLRFPQPRGLPRVLMEAPARVHCAHGERWGILRNVSRGGVFVEVSCDCPPGTEVRLEFRLPETARTLAPTAHVVWRKQREHGDSQGFGSRFLSLDARSARWLEDYVQERIAPIFLEVTRR